MTDITITELDAYHSKYTGYVFKGDKQMAIDKALLFLSGIEFCYEIPEVILHNSQSAIAGLIDDSKLNPFDVAETRQLIEKGLGRNAIFKKWAEDKNFSSVDSLSKLRSIGGVYDNLKPYLCSNINIMDRA